MNILALDTETTTYNKGSPHDPRNKLVCFSFALQSTYDAAIWDDQGRLDAQEMVNAADLIVGFNFKFDAHWIIKEGIDLSKVKIWDVQIAEFILSCQTNRFPSLNDTCIKYGIPVKEDVVKTQYWDKGIQTDEIPWEILRSYAAHDADITLQCYHAQIKLMTPAQIKLCQLQCQDMMILREMEDNGLLFDEELCHVRAEEMDDKISEINTQLRSIYPSVPINFNSVDHLSAFLYGGTVCEDGKEHIGFFKTGIKAGQPKYKNIVIEHKLPRLYQPLKGSEMAKEGNFATDEGTMRKLKGKKGVIDKLLELSKLEKLNGTYYRGLIKLRKEMNWEKGILHGQFNQTIAISGRLSSSKPNLQNFATELQDIFVSRYSE
jgi:DNA polymerase I-like protein with 3'-5' exonuclease and polymerase domains